MARRGASRTRQIRLVGIFLIVGGFGAALLLTANGNSATRNAVSSGIPPNILPPPAFPSFNINGNGTTQPQGPASVGALRVQQGYVAVAIPYNPGDVLQSHLACGDHVQVVIGTSSGTVAVDDVTILRVSTASSVSNAPAGLNPAAPGAPGLGATTTNTTAAQGAGLIVQVAAGQAPRMLAATGHSTSPIQFVFHAAVAGTIGC